MNDAYQIIIYLWNWLITLLFEDFILFDGISLGWVLIAYFVIKLLIDNVMAVPGTNKNSKGSGKNGTN